MKGGGNLTPRSKNQIDAGAETACSCREFDKAHGGIMIKAILFDCDGTLVDNESQTGIAVEKVLQSYGIEDANIPAAWTRGQTWNSIAQRIQRLYPVIADAEQLAEEFTQVWDTLVLHAPPVRGAVDAVKEAARWFVLGMVTSSPNRSVSPLLEHLGIAAFIPSERRVCAEHVTKSKPDPEGYLLAAKRLLVRPEECLVFEDSEAGILAARAAGMYCIAVLQTTTEPARCRELSDSSIQSFESLPTTFWSTLAGGTIDIFPASP